MFRKAVVGFVCSVIAVVAFSVAAAAQDAVMPVGLEILDEAAGVRPPDGHLFAVVTLRVDRPEALPNPPNAVLLLAGPDDVVVARDIPVPGSIFRGTEGLYEGEGVLVFAFPEGARPLSLAVDSGIEYKEHLLVEGEPRSGGNANDEDLQGAPAAPAGNPLATTGVPVDLVITHSAAVAGLHGKGALRIVGELRAEAEVTIPDLAEAFVLVGDDALVGGYFLHVLSPVEGSLEIDDRPVVPGKPISLADGDIVSFAVTFRGEDGALDKPWGIALHGSDFRAFAFGPEGTEPDPLIAAALDRDRAAPPRVSNLVTSQIVQGSESAAESVPDAGDEPDFSPLGDPAEAVLAGFEAAPDLGGLFAVAEDVSAGKSSDESGGIGQICASPSGDSPADHLITGFMKGFLYEETVSGGIGPEEARAVLSNWSQDSCDPAAAPLTDALIDRFFDELLAALLAPPSELPAIPAPRFKVPKPAVPDVRVSGPGADGLDNAGPATDSENVDAPGTSSPKDAGEVSTSDPVVRMDVTVPPPLGRYDPIPLSDEFEPPPVPPAFAGVDAGTVPSVDAAQRAEPMLPGTVSANLSRVTTGITYLSATETGVVTEPLLGRWCCRGDSRLWLTPRDGGGYSFLYTPLKPGTPPEAYRTDAGLGQARVAGTGVVFPSSGCLDDPDCACRDRHWYTKAYFTPSDQPNRMVKSHALGTYAIDTCEHNYDDEGWDQDELRRDVRAEFVPIRPDQYLGVVAVAGSAIAPYRGVARFRVGYQGRDTVRLESDQKIVQLGQNGGGFGFDSKSALYEIVADRPGPAEVRITLTADDGRLVHKQTLRVEFPALELR